jgi:hypothetical protein
MVGIRISSTIAAGLRIARDAKGGERQTRGVDRWLAALLHVLVVQREELALEDRPSPSIQR